ncbi:hypothetical protein C9E89_014440 [Acinetobacter sichuanensis]|uniref:Uncharacterized protein n=1 Tax=Acinetobacter sichuanensis TaxID=2136183 RepID=A0A371YMU1_9GAMM|nr:hypothetical protein C9E89_014440 [Acinetobacter sichuanensis]
MNQNLASLEAFLIKAKVELLLISFIYVILKKYSYKFCIESLQDRFILVFITQGLWLFVIEFVIHQNCIKMIHALIICYAASYSMM